MNLRRHREPVFGLVLLVLPAELSLLGAYICL